MSAGILQRIEQKLLAGWHHLDHSKIVRIIMDGYDRLSADLDKVIAENAGLKQQLAAAQAKPTGGATEDQLNSLADKLEAAMSGSGSGSGSTGSVSTAAPAPIVGPTYTTVTDSSTGNTTTVDHSTGTATTTDASGTPVATDTAAAQAATSAAQAQGVTVPSAS